MIIILVIICSILYLIMVYGVLYLYYTYRKDIEELENRCLQLEKLINNKMSTEYLDKLYDNLMTKILCLAKEIETIKNKKCKCRKEVK